MSTIKTNQLAHTANGAATYTLPQTDGSAGQVLKTDGSGNLSWTTPSAGKVIQIVQDTKTDTFMTSSASDVEVTGLSVSITPSSSSNKILVSIHLGMVGGQDDSYAGFTLYREIGGSSTDLIKGDAGGGIRPSVTFVGMTNNFEDYNAYSASFEFLDSPNTTSAITYKIKVRSGYSNNNIYINRMHTDDNQNYTFRSASTYTAREIAA